VFPDELDSGATCGFVTQESARTIDLSAAHSTLPGIVAFAAFGLISRGRKDYNT
jgi:hypothetical protein